MQSSNKAGGSFGKFGQLEKIIGYEFSNEQFLHDALLHTSANNKSASSKRFELLEFLGDRVLGMCIAELLLEQSASDIKITARRHAKLVSTDCLVQIAQLWSLDKFLIHKIEQLSSKVLADVTEALIAAIYLDSNYETVYEFIKKWFARFLTLDSTEPKTKLQEFAQAQGLKPLYTEISVIGAEHSPEYKMQVTVAGLGAEYGIGRSKHEASKNAAINLLRKLDL